MQLLKTVIFNKMELPYITPSKSEIIYISCLPIGGSGADVLWIGPLVYLTSYHLTLFLRKVDFTRPRNLEEWNNGLEYHVD